MEDMVKGAVSSNYIQEVIIESWGVGASSEKR